MKERLPLLMRASFMFSKRDIMRSMYDRVRASGAYAYENGSRPTEPEAEPALNCKVLGTKG